MPQYEMALERAHGRPSAETIQDDGERLNVGQAERAASVIAGGALAAYGLAKRNPVGIALALLGGAAILRGATGHCHIYEAMGASTAPAEEDVHIEDAVIINQPRAVLFEYWREFANLQQFVTGLESVIPIGDTRLHWVMTGPGGRRIAWDSDIIAEKKNALITWRTVPDSPVRHTAAVRFTTAPHGRGTEVRMSVEFRGPGGKVSGGLSNIIGKAPEEMLHQTLRRFKQLMEAGEIATIEGQ